MTGRALSVAVLLLGLGRAHAQLPTDAAAAVALSAEQERAAAGQAHSVAHAALGAVMGATQSAAPAAQDAPAAPAASSAPVAPAAPAAAKAPTDGAQVALGAPPDGVPSPGEIPPAYVGAAPEPVRHGRDPFRPFTLDLRGEINENEILTPLQRYELPQLRLAAIVLDLRPPRAMLQDNSGMGYIVTPGTPIGRRHGVVKAIEPHRIVVEEQVLDYYGNEQVHQVLIEMPKDNKPQQSAGQE